MYGAQPPQSDPAPHIVATSEIVSAPASMAALTSFSYFTKQ